MRPKIDLAKHGLIADETALAANFWQQNSITGTATAKVDGVGILPLSLAQKINHPDLIRLNTLLDSKDQKVQQIWSQPSDGYLITVEPELEVKQPIQTCLYATENQVEQLVQNLIVIGANSKAEILAGCLAIECAEGSSHISATEIFIDDGAELTLTMIHDWQSSSQVFPRTVVKIGQAAKFTYNYICLNAPAVLDTNPLILVDGDDSQVRSESIFLAHSKTQAQLGTRVQLNGERTRADIRTQVIASGGEVVNLGTIEANSATAYGHLECDGLMLTDDSRISAIPELIANRIGAELSHEAAIGQIAQDQIEYLQSRGLSASQAKSLIVSGLVSIADNSLLTNQIKQRLAEISF